MMKNLYIIVGWYLNNEAFYRRIEEILHKNKDLTVIVASHKEDIPKYIRKIERENKSFSVDVYPNVGYDWGAYSQAIFELGEKVKKYDYIFFMHDDIEIIDSGFEEKFIERMKLGKHMVMGNSHNSQNYPFYKTHPVVYEWAKRTLNLKLTNQPISTVRGSFFCASTIIFDKIDTIPFKHGSHPGFGNWGVKIFGALVTEHFGASSIGLYSKKYLVSDLISEYERGVSDISTRGEVKKDAAPIERKLKIHLGCGFDYRETYLNVDQVENSLADVVTDVMKLEFEENSVEEVMMYHLIEHLNRFDAEDLLARIKKWLMPGGRVIIECPDVVKVAKLVLKNRKKFEELEDGAYGFRGFYGQPFAQMHFGDYHKWGYSEFTLAQKLRIKGYSDVKTEDPQSHGQRKQRDLRIIGIK